MHVAPAAGSERGSGRQGGFSMPAQRVSHCKIEVEAPWRALQCLTPDAMQVCSV